MNPELVKNAWLTITPQRLVATPVIIGLAILLTVMSFGTTLAGVLEGWLLAAVFAFACMGGAYATAQNMIEEFAGNTWDQQRLSPLPPWSLTWGKVIGGALYPWYGALLCLAAFLAVPLALTSAHPFTWHLKAAAGLVGFALFCQALGLLTVASVANAPDRLLRYRRNYGAGLVIFVAFLGTWTWQYFVAPHGEPERIAWWGYSWPTSDFWLVSIWVFAAWTLFGAYRLMREQMQFRNLPWGWTAFTLFMMGYCAGFTGNFLAEGTPAYAQAIAWVAFLVALALAYAGLLLQPGTPLALRRLLQAARHLELAALAHVAPGWLLSYLVAIVAALVTASLPAPHAVQALVAGEVLPGDALLLALLLFAARDLGLYVLLALGRQPQRALMATIVYLLVLYLLLPPLVVALHAHALLGLFWPYAEGGAQVWPVAVELALLAAWVAHRGLNPRHGR